MSEKTEQEKDQNLLSLLNFCLQNFKEAGEQSPELAKGFQFGLETARIAVGFIRLKDNRHISSDQAFVLADEAITELMVEKPAPCPPARF